jgi:hypothetical protein
MWLQATLSIDDLKRYVSQLLPLRLSLAQPREPARVLELSAPRRVELVPSVGLRIETDGRVLWPVLGIQRATRIDRVRLRAEPHVDELRLDERGERTNEPALGFRLVIEHLEMALPSGVGESSESTIVNALNEELARADALPAWKFTRALDFAFGPPSTIELEGNVRVHATWADFRVTDDGVALAMSFRAEIQRREAAEEQETETEPEDETEIEHERYRTARRPGART